jgi:hypothetical protein
VCFQNIPRCHDLNDLLASFVGELTSTKIPYKSNGGHGHNLEKLNLMPWLCL